MIAHSSSSLTSKSGNGTGEAKRGAANARRTVKDDVSVCILNVNKLKRAVMIKARMKKRLEKSCERARNEGV